MLSSEAPCVSAKGFIDQRETDPGSPEKRTSPGGEGRGKTGPEKWMRKNSWQEPLIPALSPQPVHPRWMMCMEKTEAFFEPTLATLFIRETFRPSTQSAVREGSSSADVPPPLPTQPIFSTLPFLMVSVVREPGSLENPEEDTLHPQSLHGLAPRQSPHGTQ